MQNTGGRVYENVQPDYRWVAGVNIDLLVVDLTAFKNETEFKKEHLRVQRDGHGHLKVSGERPLGEGQGGAAYKWIRFEKVFRMSSDCITDNIVAKFDRGLLLVTMPKPAKDQLPVQAVSTPAPHVKPAPKAAGVLTTPGTVADLSKGGKPEDGKDATVAGAGADEQKKEADQKAKHAVITSATAADVGNKATAGAKEEAPGQPEVDTRKTPEPPVTLERANSQPPPPALPPLSAEAEKLRRRPRQVLVDVLVAVILLLVGLSLYLGHRCWISPEEQRASIRDGRYP